MFSITSGCPSAFASGPLRIRIRMSPVEPELEVTTMWIGLAG